MKRITAKRLLAGIGLYAALWALTQVVGVPRVRAAVAEKHIPIEDCPRLPRCDYDAVAVAPFLVRASYFWDSGTLAGGGANGLYLWFGRSSVQLWEWNAFMI